MALSFLSTGANLGTLTVRLVANSNDLVRGMNEAERAMATGAAGIANSVGAIARHLGLFAVTAGGVLTAAIGTAAVKAFGDFDEAMIRSTAIMSNMNATIRRELEMTARQMALHTTTGADTLAKGYYNLASAGMNAQQAMKALPVVERFSVAAGLDLSKSIDLVAGSLSALGLRMKDPVENMENMQRLTDLLVKVNNLALGTVEDFAEALSHGAAASMKNYNVEVEEGIAVLAAFAEQNVRGREAGDKFQVFLRDLQRSALDNEDAFRRFNIRVFDQNYNLRALTDIVADFEKEMEGMSSGERKAMFEMLGFQDRSLRATLALLGTSKSIKEYREQLNSAGGETQRVADQILTGFYAQWEILGNHVKEVLRIIGEDELAPALSRLNRWLQDATANTESFRTTIREFSSGALTGFIKAAGLVSDVFYGWQLIMVSGRIYFASFFEYVTMGMGKVVTSFKASIEGLSNFFISSANLTLRAMNAFLPKQAQISMIEPLDLKSKESPFDPWIQRFRSNVEVFQEELSDMVNKGPYSERMKAAVDDFGKNAVKTSDGYNEAVKKIIAADNKTIASFHKVVEASDGMRASIEANSMRMTTALDKMGAPNPTDALGRNIKDQLTAGVPFNKAGMTKTEMDLAVRGVGGLGGEDQGVTQALTLRKEMEASELRLRELKRISEKEVGLTQDVYKRKLQVMEMYHKQLKRLQLAETEMILGTSSKMFGDLSTIAEAFAGKQSGVYKAMFAASKAFAIAESTVKIMQGVAEAASMPWPANLAAMASVVAATANIVSTIQSVKLEFAGERKFGGSVTAGKMFLVGEEGPEMFVPKAAGDIISNNNLNKLGAGSNQRVRVTINNYTDAKAEMTEREEGGERVLEVVIRRVEKDFASKIKDGRGDLGRSLESTFGLRRASR